MISNLILFQILSVVIFFSSMVAGLYHLGVIQWVIVRIGWFFQKVLGTTAAESLVSAGNIFVGMVSGFVIFKTCSMFSRVADFPRNVLVRYSAEFVHLFLMLPIFVHSSDFPSVRGFISSNCTDFFLTNSI